MEETSEYFKIRILHLTTDQSKTVGKPTQRLIIYPTKDFTPYISRISQKYKGDAVGIITELLYQSDKHLTTFTEVPYSSVSGNMRNILVETHIFIFRRIKGDNGDMLFQPKKDMI